ncbi:hypothetical protein HRbin20_00774 [bacterium HR20]|nr:hypothetical protein HRbin20_00774 [bacterium HR20]
MPPTTMLSAEQLYHELYRLADGVLYPSETDAPVDVLLWEVSQRGALTIDALLDAFGISPQQPVSDVPPEDFFEGVTDTYDWQNEEERAMTERFRRMKELFFANVTNPKHYWVGERNVHVFLWGRTSDGNYIILKTGIVET